LARRSFLDHENVIVHSLKRREATEQRLDRHRNGAHKLTVTLDKCSGASSCKSAQLFSGIILDHLDEGLRCVAGNNGQLPTGSDAVCDLPDRLTKSGTIFRGDWPKALGS
jgi:hypothetical protein